MLFDLDPSPGVTLAQTGRVALLVRDALEVLDLRAVVKTSSAEGMHLAVPLRPGHTYAQARSLVQLVAQALERAHPDLVTTEWDKSRRHGVLIDSNQVGYGRTMSVAYCVRPRPGAPVSMPLTWDEVESGAFARARPTMRAALRPDRAARRSVRRRARRRPEAAGRAPSVEHGFHAGDAREPRAVTAAGSDDARDAGLRYSSDSEPGITRRRAGTGFSYRGPRGTLVRATRQLARIRALAIPPAWSEVWICPDRARASAGDRPGRARAQAVPLPPRLAGAARRHQVRPHAGFGEALPRLRERIESDLGLPGLPRERVLAAVVRLVDETLIRVGNEEYRRANGSFGATTIGSASEVDGLAHQRSSSGARAASCCTPRSPTAGWRARCSGSTTCRGGSSSSTSTRTSARAGGCAREDVNDYLQRCRPARN